MGTRFVRPARASCIGIAVLLSVGVSQDQTTGSGYVVGGGGAFSNGVSSGPGNRSIRIGPARLAYPYTLLCGHAIKADPGAATVAPVADEPFGGGSALLPSNREPQSTRLMQPRKLLARVSREDVQNVIFGALPPLEHFGFANVRTAGGHRVYIRPAIPELVNLQNIGGQARSLTRSGRCCA